MFKYTAEDDSHYMGIPARDLYESDMARLTDEQKATLGASAFYRPRNDADEIVAEATRRVERAEPAPTILEAQAIHDMPAPKEAAKK